MPGLKKCYYEVLGVERNATDDEIKKAYRKLALQLHPDKNMDRLDEAKEEFQLLQQANEVLSNPQERAWYDEHRHAVLRGGLNEDFEDEGIDLMPYCLSSCFKGFGNDEKGFYSVYRELFERIAAEEMEAGYDSDEEIPSFGDSTSEYDKVGRRFYAFWEAFCTRKNFAWLDEFDTRRADNRRVSRLMDKENKKIRVDAKREWNQRVRALVDFVKLKDKRVHEWRKQQEIMAQEKEKALKQKIIQEKAQRQKERKELLESAKKRRNNSGSQDQLKEMESWMAKEYGDEDDISEEEPEGVMCRVCNKVFRTMEAFSSHERSKKHLQQVRLHAAQESSSESEVASDADGENESETKELETEDLDGKESNLEQNYQHTDEKHDSQKRESEASDDKSEKENDEGEDMLPISFTNLNLNEHKRTEFEVRESGFNGTAIDLAKEGEEDPATLTKAKKKRRRAPKTTAQEKVPAAAAAPFDEQKLNRCEVCSAEFPNRNKLFRHLESSGHAIPLSAKIASSNSSSKRKQGKQKGK